MTWFGLVKGRVALLTLNKLAGKPFIRIKMIKYGKTKLLFLLKQKKNFSHDLIIFFTKSKFDGLLSISAMVYLTVLLNPRFIDINFGAMFQDSFNID